MSFAKFKDKIENGDTVMLYLGFDNMHRITVKSGDVFQTRYGALKHSDLVGVRFGSRVHCKKGYLYVLHPTPEFWTSNLPHRTQILYTTDISMITMQLDLKPGSIVVESGTGSGSLSHSLLRTIMPTGHLFTFEFHEQRAKIAAQEFLVHGLDDYVTVNHRDVCQDGFQLTGLADAVFLDLPKPWEVIASAKQALKPTGGRICSFSPCIEQVQRTCEVLTQHGFEELKTIECLLRNYDVRTINLPIANLGPETTNDNSTESSELKPSMGNGAVENITSQELNSECKAGGVVKSENESSSAANEQKVPESDEKTAKNENDCEGESSAAKKQKLEESDKKTAKNENDTKVELNVAKKHKVDESDKKNSKNIRHDFDLIGKKDVKSFFFKTAAPSVQMPGHTGFLTFATLYTQS